MLDKLEKAFVGLNRWLLILILSAMSVIIFANVVLRYSSGISLSWAEEVARHLMIWLTFVGAGPVLRYGGHIAIDNLQDALPIAAARFLRILIALLLTGLFGFFMWFGWEYLDRTRYQMTPATQISFAYIYAALPLGGLMALLHWFFIMKDYVLERKFASDAHFDATASASL